jgi:mono/diheme cytochrome c family protein
MKKTFLFLAIFAITSLSVAAGAAETPSPENAAIDGATLLQNRCGSCHSVEKVTNKTKSAKGWEANISRMVKKGAKLTEEEKAILVDYMAKNYAPQ